MALKRSGVRASLAPYTQYLVPRARQVLRSCVFRPISISLARFLPLICSFCAVAISLSGAIAQKDAPKTNATTKTDVVLFVRPDGPASARIGLAYRKRIPHQEVRNEINKLLAVSGWKLSGDPAITDGTVHADNPKGFPPTTAAMFGVTDAPQFHDNAPVLAHYLQAFQAWNRVEVLFVTPNLQPYNGVTNFHTPSLDVAMAKSDGVYSYVATIREHSKSLPPLIRDASEPQADVSGRTNSKPTGAHDPIDSAGSVPPVSPSRFWPSLFILVGSLLTGGVALQWLARRRVQDVKPRRLP
jgi:hypothetical protein